MESGKEESVESERKETEKEESVESERKEPEKEESVEESETSKNILKLVTSHKSCDVKL